MSFNPISEWVPEVSQKPITDTDVIVAFEEVSKGKRICESFLNPLK